MSSRGKKNVQEDPSSNATGDVVGSQEQEPVDFGERKIQGDVDFEEEDDEEDEEGGKRLEEADERWVDSHLLSSLQVKRLIVPLLQARRAKLEKDQAKNLSAGKAANFSLVESLTEEVSSLLRTVFRGAKRASAGEGGRAEENDKGKEVDDVKYIFYASDRLVNLEAWVSKYVRQSLALMTEGKLADLERDLAIETVAEERGDRVGERVFALSQREGGEPQVRKTCLRLSSLFLQTEEEAEKLNELYAKANDVGTKEIVAAKSLGIDIPRLAELAFGAVSSDKKPSDGLRIALQCATIFLNLVACDRSVCQSLRGNQHFVRLIQAAGALMEVTKASQEGEKGNSEDNGVMKKSRTPSETDSGTKKGKEMTEKDGAEKKVWFDEAAVASLGAAAATAAAATANDQMQTSPAGLFLQIISQATSSSLPSGSSASSSSSSSSLSSSSSSSSSSAPVPSPFSSMLSPEMIVKNLLSKASSNFVPSSEQAVPLFGLTGSSESTPSTSTFVASSPSLLKAINDQGAGKKNGSESDGQSEVATITAPPPAASEKLSTTKGTKRRTRDVSAVHDSFGGMLSLEDHILFLELLENGLKLSDRNVRDWKSLERKAGDLPERISKNMKQKAKRILQERRSRRHLRFWETLKKLKGNTAAIKSQLKLMIGPKVGFEEEFFDEIAAHLDKLLCSGKRSPGFFLDWPEKPKKVFLDKLLDLHKRQYKDKPFQYVFHHFDNLFTLTDIELGILSTCDCDICLEDWKMKEVNRISDSQLRLHWTKEKAALLRHILVIHRDHGEAIAPHIPPGTPKFKNWTPSEFDATLRAAHTMETCEVCQRHKFSPMGAQFISAEAETDPFTTSSSTSSSSSSSTTFPKRQKLQKI